MTTGYRLVVTEREDRPADPVVRHQRCRRPEGRRRHRQGQAARSREGRNRPPLDTDRGERHDHRRLLDVRGPRLPVQHQRQGPGPRVRHQDRQAAVALQHDSRARASSATTPGRTGRGNGPATSACGPRSRSTRRPASSTCRWKRRPSTNTAATVRATTSSPRASSRWTCGPASASGTSSMIHHGLWDHDNSSASLLIDANINGQPRKLLAQPSKQGWLYVFDRITGQPIWPIPEVAVPQTNMPTEKTAATQPIPTNPPPYSRTFVGENDLIDFTPALRAQALEEPEEVPVGAVAVRSAAWPERSAPRLDQHRQHRRRRELAGLGLRPRNRDLLHAGEQHQRHRRQVRRGRVRAGPRGSAQTPDPRKPRWEAEPNYGLRGTNQPGGAPPVHLRTPHAGCGSHCATRPSAAARHWSKGSTVCRSSSRHTASSPAST